MPQLLQVTAALLVATFQKSGQIIATSHDLTPNGGLVREIPLFQENPRLVKYYSIWPEKSFRSLWFFVNIRNLKRLYKEVYLKILFLHLFF